MSPIDYISRGLRFHRRMHVAVALGVMVATAVLAGALVVGDSIRGSLRHLALDRLGQIDSVLVAPRFFRAKLADEVAAFRDPQQPNLRIQAAPGFLLRATLANSDVTGTAGKSETRTAGQVTLLGVDERFWQLAEAQAAGAPPKIGRDEIALGAPLAEKLGAEVGSEIVVRIARPSDIPAESALGRKSDTVRAIPALRVVAILPPDNGLGQFGLSPTQQQTFDAFVDPATLQAALNQPDRANAIFARVVEQSADGSHAAPAPLVADDGLLKQALRPKLADYGLTLQKMPRGYFMLSSDRMLLDAATDKAADAAFGPLGGQPTFTYLANEISAKNTARIPYSTITAIDFHADPPLGPFPTPAGHPIPPLADDEIVLNQWAVDDMAKQGVTLKAGDPVRIEYFRAEGLHAGGGESDEAVATLHYKEVVELGEAAADRYLTPELKGVTDKRSIANWDPPFKFDESRIRPQDEKYWRDHGALPKAFVSLECGRRLWGSRFGQTTSWRIPAGPEMTVASLGEQLALDPAAEGFSFLPVRQQALSAADGPTDFDQLFLYFSAFIIIAAVMLVALLFKLGIDGRASEIGLLRAVGFSRRQIRRLLIGEGLVVAVAGSAAGVALGLGYAWLMLVGLRTWWLAAVGTRALQLHATVGSLVEGFAIGVIVSLATIWISLLQLRRLSTRQLLAGDATPPPRLRLREEEEHAAAGAVEGGNAAKPQARRRVDWTRRVAVWGLLSAVVLAAAGFFTTGGSSEARAGMFMSVAMLVLTVLLIAIWGWLRSDARAAPAPVGHWRIARLAIRNGGRHPLRSTLTIGLMAAAAFLIVSMSAFQLHPPSGGADRDSGDGGFALVAQSELPIYQDLGTPEGRSDLGFEPDDRLFAAKRGEKPDADIYPLRVQAGDDASCLNLYRPRQPRILGLPPNFVDRGGFAWGATAAKTPEEHANPWLLLRGAADEAKNGSSDGPIPVVLDDATATYILHLDGVGSTLHVTAADGTSVSCQVVGLLENSLFQGDLLMSEADLLRLFPGNGGYRYFLVELRGASAQAPEAARDDLDATLADYGFDAESTAARLAGFMAVENTYLSTFQSLGGLGLLLGAVGLAVAQLRSVFERRGELALMQAIGFRRRRLAAMVLWENATLLLAGLGVGAIAALVAIAPQLAAGGATIPWKALGATLLAVLIVGLAAGTWAVRATLRAPLIPALRGE